ncbi:DNA topoisomerase 2-associated protein pat1 [Aspergillus lentulus]|uniref:DNA topoisomerase 2-associated protein pat1 n=1 Tax=Aspergillus lentulus TaxID=293939 RepID=A0AAN4PNE2_ASPLE|nr:DNA topoisomerase 2-associated protein pat1 [Aspergillus lentulus]GAQ09572.1 DNA topoisomerase 2-associated protein pat1 [Aspergillus lentulus]GFF38189.1 DNA topoisomerase 2-associated protein pat1 [Aspergillus lentulus]GFF46235.1 DNA topoisomerase 2-associated protein pat1 [Aspergillus lentulus]GFF63803.1 DNA topoisomerase 2-associated protein pat1 [Aspergillus lentulus]GFF65441.1 DNA topoisomerase 2-associated protein pat1 [Aspergillus lentulus]
MSFFGFDTTLPRDRAPAGEKRGFFEAPDPFAEVARAGAGRLADDDDAIDFEDTYDGLGDQLNDDQDAFNEDTFGDVGTGSVGKDFDFFGQTAQVADAIGEEQVRFNLQHPGAPSGSSAKEIAAQPPATSVSGDKPKRTGYEKYQDPGYIPDLQAKSSVWGLQKKPEPAHEPVHEHVHQHVHQHVHEPVSQAKKMLSLEEVEAQLRSHGIAPVQPPVSMPMPMPDLSHLQRNQQLPNVPEAFSQLPPEFLQAQFPKDVPPAHLLHHPSMVPEPFSLPPSAPNVPLHLLQNANILPQHMASPQRQAIPPRVQQPPPQHPPPQAMKGANAGLPLITNPQQLMQLTEEQRMAYLMEDAKRAKRNHKIFLLSKGNGLMTPQDKNFITRIQLQQLVAAAGNVADADLEAVLAEDFYYQVYSQIRGAPRQHPHQPLGHFAQTYLLQTGNRLGGHGRRNLQSADNHMQRMQQQVQRAVEAAKAKPKNKQLIIEGSLGKISFSNAKAPKPMLNIKRPETSDGAKAAKKQPTDLSLSDRKSILMNIENVYSTLMDMEDMERTMPPLPDENDSEAIQKHLEWRQKIRSLNQKLWQELKVMEPIVPNTNTPHPFIAFLSYPKGKKAIPRIFRHIDQEQRVTILTMIVVHLDTLDVVRSAQPVPGENQPSLAVREAIDLFSQAVLPSLLGYVNEAPFNIIIGLLGLVIAQTHVQLVAKTRIGLGILTMLLSRAEIVKEAGQAAERDWQQWVEKFNVLFDTLEPIFADIFPASINAGDDMYVWQFLAAVGIGASPEQQQRLVIAVKDRVMETVTYSKTLPADMASQRLGNVNLFMRAIGLDVELLG